MSDLRPEIDEERRRVGRRLIRRTVPGGIIFLVLGGLTALVPDLEPAFRLVGAATVAIGVTTLVGAVSRRRGLPPPRTVTWETGSATAVPRSTPEFAEGILMVGMFGAGCAAAAVATAPTAPVGAVVLAALAIPTLALAGYALAGRYVVGGVWLTPTHLVYRAYGLETRISWDAVGLVRSSEPMCEVSVVARPGHQVQHHYRAGRFRGQKHVGPTAAVISARDLALLPTDLARAIHYYAGPRSPRLELGTGSALLRLEEIARRPIPSREVFPADEVRSADAADPAALADRVEALGVLVDLSGTQVRSTRRVARLTAFVSAAVLGLFGSLLLAAGWGDGAAAALGAIVLAAGVGAFVLAVRPPGPRTEAI